MVTACSRRRTTAEASALSYRLELTIGGTSYAIEPLPEAPVAGGRAFRLTKGDGTTYDVAQTAYGPECDCPDYIFRRDGLDPEGCKHVKAMVGSGLISNRPIRTKNHLA
jgi:hypothetical protein